MSTKESESTVLDLESALAQLRDLAPGRVPSTYLDTSPARLDGQKYLLLWRDGLRSIRPHLPPEESEIFEAAADVHHYLMEEFAAPRARPGVVCRWST